MRRKAPETDPSGDPDLFLSIEDGPEVELQVKGSRFLTQAFRADSDATMTSRLGAVRKQYHDATHHCWAVRTGGPDSLVERWSDDGEPSGTAGLPILGSIRRGGLHEVLIVVTRYFGGTKLGSGGLTRAYGESARMALAAAPRREIWRLARLEVTCAFETVGVVETAIVRAGTSVHSVERAFAPTPRFLLLVRAGRAVGLEEAIREASAGKARVEQLAVL